MNNNVTVQVPNWFIDTVHVAQRNMFAFIGTIVIAILVIVLTALFKGKWNVKYEEAKAKALTKRAIAVFTVVISSVGSIGYFITENMGVLHNLPYIGPYIATVLGLVWSIYNLGAKFKSVEQAAAKWAGTESPTETTTENPTPPVAEPGQFL